MNENGHEMTCPTQVADVGRPLRSVSQVTGGANKPALASMVYINRIGCVVPPGYVERVLAQMKKYGATPIATYKRDGNLYTASMRMSSFTRSSATQEGYGTQIPERL